MQDHNFEDQVHRKLDNMQLHPSEGVWKKVEEQITRKKKRRRFILWLPLLFVFFTTGYLYFYSNSYAPAKTPDASQQVNQTSQAAGNRISITPKVNNRLYKHIPHAGDEPEKRSGKVTGGMPVTKHNIISNDVFPRQTPVPAPGIPSGQRLPENAATANSHASNRKPVTVRDKFYNEPAAVGQFRGRISETAESRAGNDRIMNNEIALKPATTYQQIVTNTLINTPNSIINRPSFTSASVEKHFHPARWEWMLTATYGKSGINNSVFSSWSGIQADAMNNFSVSAASVTVSHPPPSAIHPGNAFSAGISVRRQLFRKLSWSAGLQYTQFTSQITTGNFINDTAVIRTANPAMSRLVNQYYATGAKRQYTNRMHFIELPVQLDARLTGLRRLPIFWNVGFSVSRLMASNALVYNTGAQIYYRDNSLFNHTQCNISTGFDVQLFTNSIHPLQVGPQLRYSITPLYTSEADDNKHQFFYGVRAALLISKKYFK